MPQFFEDLLTDDEHQEVDWHLRRCLACREYASSTGSLSYLIREMGAIEAPEDLTETIKFRIDQAREHGVPTSAGSGPRKNRPGKILGVAAVFTLAAGLMFVLFFMEEPALQTDIQRVATAPEAAAGADVPVKKQVTGEEAEALYGKLEVMADTLTKAASGYRKETPESAKEKAAQDDSGSG